MARYFFDIHDGPLSGRDTDGQDIPSLEDAKREALRALWEMSGDLLHAGSPNRLMIDVRDESGTVVLSTRLTLEVVNT
jgi:hypothetical protein